MPRAKGPEIRSRRQQLGMKLRELSDVANVPYKTLANAEACNQYLSVEFAWRLARVLGGDAGDCEAADLVEMASKAA